MSKAESSWEKKRRSLGEMLKGFADMPRQLAYSGHDELTSEELDGNPINRISGNLANSFNPIQIGKDSWALQQTTSQAPYAQRVMVPVSIARAGKPALTLMRDRMAPIWSAAIVAEFKAMVAGANRGGYTYNAKTFAKKL